MIEEQGAGLRNLFEYDLVMRELEERGCDKFLPH